LMLKKAMFLSHIWLRWAFSGHSMLSSSLICRG
jgi:formate hydrogenlyase subunit 3/multisubunit Na+/H+ antiporter MnhD subunit